MRKTHKFIESCDFRALSRTAPALAGQLAYLRFCTPRLSERRAIDHTKLSARARVHLRAASWSWLETPAGRCRTYTYVPDGREPIGDVLIVHGWTSEAAFMTVFAEQIRRAGFRAVLLDCPAHGLSPGERVSLIGCAHAVSSALKSSRNATAVVAHSMGCLATLLALEGHPPMRDAQQAGKLVLISSPDRFQDITREHGRHLGLTSAAQRVFEHHLERIAHRDIATFRGASLLAQLRVPTLLLHGAADHEVPSRCSEQIAAAAPTADLVIFDGLDHRILLYAPPVIRKAVAFLSDNS